MENNERPIMGEEERRFKVQKIEKYEEMIGEADKEIGWYILASGIALGIITISGGIAKTIAGDNDFFVNLNLMSTFSLNIIFSIQNIISSIAKKYSLKANLNMLQDELELDDEFQKTKRK